jgi:hypothetical protein
LDHSDQDGGGRIVRTIYVEPYTAAHRVEAALKGTVYPDVNNFGAYKRAKPHADPLKPWYFCQDVQIEPQFPSAATAARNMAFNGNAESPQYGNQFNIQFDAIQRALNVVDDFDGANFVDNLTAAEIPQSQATYAGAGDTYTVNSGESIPVDSFFSRGALGAKITATYLPLIFQPGLSASVDPFDYVDPQWEPLTITTQTGRSLWLFAPTGVGNTADIHTGLTDTFALPEVVWRFTIRRLLVPFKPANVIGLLTNKTNQNQINIGNENFPVDTIRMEAPEVYLKRAADGQIYCDILLKFLVRKLYDEYFQPSGPNAGTFIKGNIGWNWAYAVPNYNPVADTIGHAFSFRAGYYPVCWNGGLFNYFGTNHPLFLHDFDAGNAISMLPGGLQFPLNSAPFNSGFYANQ